MGQKSLDKIKKRPKSSKTSFGVVDLGSNAMRFALYENLGKSSHLECIYYERNPVRLGAEVFDSGSVPEEKIQELEQIFQGFFLTSLEYGIPTILAVATSALREAKNGHEVCKRIEMASGIHVNVISGDLEAQIVQNAIADFIPTKNESLLTLDIGGGSTEFIFSENNEIRDKISLPLGTLRLQKETNLKLLEEKLKQVLNQSLNQLIGPPPIELDLAVMGIGGNLRAIGKLRKKLFKNVRSTVASVEEVHQIYRELTAVDYYSRIEIYELSEDRADVIIPACFIVKEVLDHCGISEILLPKVGLKDGLTSLLETY